MRNKTMALLVGLASIVAFLAASSSASATLSINATRTTATAGATSLIDSSAGRTVNCTGSSLVDTIATSGASTITNQAFTSCRESATGIALTFSNPSGGIWRNTITALLSGGQITGVLILITVPLGTAHFSDSLGICQFDISGTQAALVTVTPRTPPNLVSVGSIAVPGVGTLGTALGLTLSNVTSGCSLLGVRSGDLSRFSGTYTLSPAVTGTLNPV